MGFLQRVPILQTLSPEEVLTVADALQTEDFRAGQVIVQEGASGADRFYIVEKVGTASGNPPTQRSSGSGAVRCMPLQRSGVCVLGKCKARGGCAL